MGGRSGRRRARWGCCRPPSDRYADRWSVVPQEPEQLLGRSPTSMARHEQFITSVILKRGAVGSFDSYPFSIPAVRHLDELRFPTPATFFVGENGSGKSTLLEALAVAAGLNAEGGSRNFRFATRATHSELSDYLRLVRAPRRPTDAYFLRAETFYNVASAAEQYGVAEQHGGGRSPHEQSHGESFMALVLHRLRGIGLYLFDEPEAGVAHPPTEPTRCDAPNWSRVGRSSSSQPTHRSCWDTRTLPSTISTMRESERWPTPTLSTMSSLVRSSEIRSDVSRVVPEPRRHT